MHLKLRLKKRQVVACDRLGHCLDAGIPCQRLYSSPCFSASQPASYEVSGNTMGDCVGRSLPSVGGQGAGFLAPEPGLPRSGCWWPFVG